jgi:hypothetical protein
MVGHFYLFPARFWTGSALQNMTPELPKVGKRINAPSIYGAISKIFFFTSYQDDCHKRIHPQYTYVYL